MLRPISCHWSFLLPPEYIRKTSEKPEVFWCFRGHRKKPGVWNGLKTLFKWRHFHLPLSILWIYIFSFQILNSEAATRGIIWKKVFLNILQYLQKNTCVGVSFLKKLEAYICTSILKNICLRTFKLGFSLINWKPPENVLKIAIKFSKTQKKYSESFF